MPQFKHFSWLLVFFLMSTISSWMPGLVTSLCSVTRIGAPFSPVCLVEFLCVFFFVFLDFNIYRFISGHLNESAQTVLEQVFAYLGLLRGVYWYLFADISGQPIITNVKAVPLKVGLMGCFEMSVTNYQSTLRDNPEERRSHLHRPGSMKYNMKTVHVWEHSFSKKLDIMRRNSGNSLI